MLSELESQNDEQVKRMIGKMRLKNLSIQVGDEIGDSSALVEKEGFEGIRRTGFAQHSTAHVSSGTFILRSRLSQDLYAIKDICGVRK